MIKMNNRAVILSKFNNPIVVVWLQSAMFFRDPQEMVDVLTKEGLEDAVDILLDSLEDNLLNYYKGNPVIVREITTYEGEPIRLQPQHLNNTLI